MKNLLVIMILLATGLLSGCLYDKGDIAEPINGCDTTYYHLTIKPIIDNNCASSGCHDPGGSGTGDYTSYAGIKPYLDNGSVQFRINLDPADPLHMPLGNVLSSSDKSKLDQWIADGYIGCD